MEVVRNFPLYLGEAAHHGLLVAEIHVIEPQHLSANVFFHPASKNTEVITSLFKIQSPISSFTFASSLAALSRLP